VDAIGKVDGSLLLPIKDNPHADKVLMLPTVADKHVFARVIGSAAGGYVSNLLHGVRVDGGINWDDEPLFKDGVAREDPRATKVDDSDYLTYTRLGGDGYGVGLSVIDDPGKPHELREVGEIIRIGEEGVDSKDACILRDRVDGKVGLLVRLKPGIQLALFDDMQDLMDLASDSERRDAFWSRFRKRYNEDPRRYNHLHPNMPEMKLWESRWRNYIDDRIKQLVNAYPESHFYDIDVGGPYWYGTGPTPLPVEKDGRRYLLAFHHRGQVIGELTEEGVKKRTMDKERPDNLKFYCVLATLHDHDDPRKLVAVSPLPLSLPSPWRYAERGARAGVKDPMMSKDAVPFVYITAGAALEERHNDDYVFLPISVNDVYTVMKWYRKNGLMGWMLRDGKIEEWMRK